MSEVFDATLMTPGKRWRSLIAVLLMSVLVGIAMGAAMPMVSMAMELRGASAITIGWVVAASPMTLLLTTPFIGVIVNRFGLFGAMIGGGVVMAAVLALMPHFYGPVPWFILRLVNGVGIAIMWILGETWINALATRENRGRVIMAYTLLLTVGFAIGPVLSQMFGTHSWMPFYLAAGLIALALVPIFLARDVAPILPESPKHAFLSTFRAAPLIMSVALIAGFTDAAQISFLPIYGMRMGLTADRALDLVVALVAGSCAVLLCVGWLADRMNRRALLLWCLAIACTSGAVLPFVLFDPIFVWPVLAIWGGSTFSLYSVSLVIIGDRFPHASLAGANAAFVGAFETGSVTGPVVIGYTINLFGPNGMPVLLVAICLPLFALAYIRYVQRRRGVIPLGGEDTQ